MRTTSVALTLLAAACTTVGAGSDTLRARVLPRPASLSANVWTPTVRLSKPVGAPPALTVRKGTERVTFKLRATTRRSYRVRVRFPSDGHWRWTLTSRGRALAQGAIRIGLTFRLPYDLALAPDGSIYFLDMGRVLLWRPDTRHVTLYARTSSDELSALVRARDGTLYVADIPGHRILRIDTARRVTVVASIRAPGDMTIDPAGTTLWVGSIEDGVFRIDLSTGRVDLIDGARGVHGIDRDAAGNLFVHDSNTISRIDGATGAKTTFSRLDGIKLLAAPDGSVYASVGSPAGGRIYRITPDGTATPVVGTGAIGTHADGRALDAQIGPFAMQLAPDGALLLTQTQPIAAIRRVDLVTGVITTLARGD
jgi:sugar lactone lactonase YvrE